MELVEHGLGPGPVEPHVALPVERVVDHDGAGDRGRGVAVVGQLLVIRRIAEHARPVEADRAVDRLRVGVDQELCGIEAIAPRRLPGAVDAVGVALTGADAREVDVPVVRRPLAHLDALLDVGLVVEAELDALGALAEEREVRPVAVPGRAEGKGPTGPDRASHRSTVAVLPGRP